MKTVGVSSKVVATSITAAVAPVVVAFLADAVGFDIDVDTAVAVLGPVVLLATTFVVGYLARADIVVDEDEVALVEDDSPPDSEGTFER